MCKPEPELNIKTAIIIVALVILAHVVFTMAAYGVLFGLAELLDKNNPSDFPFEIFRTVSSLFVVIADGLVVTVLYKRFRFNLKSELPNVPISQLLLHLTLAFFIFAMITPLVHPWNFIEKMFDGNLIVHELTLDLSSIGFSRMVYFLLMVFVVPVLEEVIFRGFIFRFLLRRYSVVTAIFVSSFLFAFMHLRFMGFAYLFVYGLLFAYSYSRTRSLLTPILLHVFINLMANLTTNQIVQLNSENLVKHLLFYLVGTACVVFTFSVINRGENALRIEIVELKAGFKSIFKKSN